MITRQGILDQLSFMLNVLGQQWHGEDGEGVLPSLEAVIRDQQTGRGFRFIVGVDFAPEPGERPE